MRFPAPCVTAVTFRLSIALLDWKFRSSEWIYMHMKDDTDQLIDALDRLDINSLSFVQLRKLNAALSDKLERVGAISADRSAEDTLGDTVRVAVRPPRES